MKIKGSTGKAILRRLLYKHAPRQLFERPKAGFAMPVGEWLKGPLRDWAEDLLDPRSLAAGGYFDPARVGPRWQSHLKGERDSSQPLWAVLMFEAWLRHESGEAGGAAKLAA
jgi:asparagine synthase (glutamine-hydrolysing)